MGRQEVESRAVESILRWMNEHGGRGLIDYTESSVDLGKLWTPYNYHLWSYWLGAILAAPTGRNYRTILYPLVADDSPDEVRWSEDAVRTMVRLMANRTVDLQYPILHMTKREIIAEMPADLLQLVWWCAKPYGGRPCHACDSCELMDAALRDPLPCKRLPAGWTCSLPGGHDGACAVSRDTAPPLPSDPTEPGRPPATRKDNPA